MIINPSAVEQSEKDGAVSVQILEKICENVTLNDSNPSYTFPSAITLDSNALYYLTQDYFSSDGTPDYANGGFAFSRVEKDSSGNAFARWLTADSANSVTLTKTGITNTWRESGKKTVISIYKVEILVKDKTLLAALTKEGYDAVASGNYSHAEGKNTTASGMYAHAEGAITTASGDRSHAEGGTTTASGAYAHAEGAGTLASGTVSHAEGGAYAGSAGSKATAYAAHAEGVSTEASGQSAHAEGSSTVASGESAHAEGSHTTASGDNSHAEGYYSKASKDYSHAEGFSTKAEGQHSHTEGCGTTASGDNSHAEGFHTTASGHFSHASGYFTIAGANQQTAIGGFNVKSTNGSDKLIIGKGGAESSRANCFRATDTGVYATGAHNSSGADYAELFEWLDGNPDHEDRCGRFVTLEGEKIRLAGPGDSFILGIVSGNPSVVGDVYDDQWQGMYLYDIFGRPLYEDVEVPDELGPNGEVLIPAHVERRQKLNPAYDHTQPYQPRSQRPEWDAVGMLGKLVMVDDGTCQVNGWCTVGDGGAATRSEVPSKYRVIARLDACHVRVLIL